MRWFRYHQRFGGILALFALGLQLAVSFAHVHPQGLDLLPGAESLARASTQASDSPAGPSDHHGGTAPYEECAICISIGLLSSGISGQPPILSLPVPVGFAPTPAVVEVYFSVARFSPFRTRAPPVV